MTSRDLYEAVLIELNKAKVPSLLLEDFNYFANKAITQYVNRQYSMYDVMTTQADSLRVLQASVHL